MILFDNIDAPELLHYRSLRFTPQSHTKDSLFIAEGEKAVKRLLHSSLTIHSILLTSEFYEKYKELIELKNIIHNRVFLAEKNIMEQIVGFNIHSGIMAMAEIPCDTSPENMESPVVILNGIINSENIGSIVRNCVAFNIHSLIVCEKSSSPWLRRAVRVSMGNVIDMKIFHSKDIAETLSNLKNNGFKLFAAELTKSSVSFRDQQYPHKSAIIFGSEGNGISNNILEIVHNHIKIPMNEVAVSLNVASSSAIILEYIANFKKS